MRLSRISVRYRYITEQTQRLPSLRPVPVPTLLSIPVPALPQTPIPPNLLETLEPEEEEEKFLRIGLKLCLLALLIMCYVTVALVDFYLFSGSLLIIFLTEAVGLVVFSTLLARWARWYLQHGNVGISTKHTQPIIAQVHPTQKIKPARQFEMLQTDTVSYLRALRVRKE